LIASSERSSNRLVDIEALTEDELNVLMDYYINLSQKAEMEKDLFSSHSLDEAEDNHQQKKERRKKKKSV
jgi:hypothetical protein